MRVMKNNYKTKILFVIAGLKTSRAEMNRLGIALLVASCGRQEGALPGQHRFLGSK